MGKDWLIVETSGRTGRVGLARAESVFAEVALDHSRKHARDLAQTIQTLLQHHALTPMQLEGVLVSLGPGSYTGLRVGIISAKVFAYAAGIALVGVPTFHGIVQAVAGHTRVAVIADALKGKAYVQEFEKQQDGWKAIAEIRIETFTEWVKRCPTEMAITGPGMRAGIAASIPPNWTRLPEETWDPTCPGLWHARLGFPPFGREEILALEPLYLRGSSAEEQAKQKAEASS